MEKKEIIERVNNFINTVLKENGIDLDDDDFDLNHHDDESNSEFSFKHHNKPYYLYWDGEDNGYFHWHGLFVSIKEMQEFFFIKNKEWDNFTIFDVEQNEIVKPTLVLK